MGEYAKRIGEVGENVVVDFLNIIGWKNPQRNVDILSTNPEEHGKSPMAMMVILVIKVR